MLLSLFGTEAMGGKGVKQTDIETTILRSLYEAWFSPQGGSNLDQLRNQRGWDTKESEKTVTGMAADGFIQERTADTWKLTTLDVVIWLEDRGIAPEEALRENEHIRTLALNALHKLHREKGRRAEADAYSPAERLGVGPLELVTNLVVLEHSGEVENTTAVFWRITNEGTDAVRRQKPAAN